MSKYIFTNPAGGGGMLYRLGEHVVYLLPPGDQENVLTLTKLLRVKSINDYFFCHWGVFGTCNVTQ